MSFLYPRLITVRRQRAEADFGAVPYTGNTPDNEIDVIKGIRASIQEKKTRGNPEGGVPSDAYARSEWAIFVPSQNRTLIKERDVVVDDANKRYVINAAYWNSLGYRLSAELLEA